MYGTQAILLCCVVCSEVRVLCNRSSISNAHTPTDTWLGWICQQHSAGAVDCVNVTWAFSGHPNSDLPEGLVPLSTGSWHIVNVRQWPFPCCLFFQVGFTSVPIRRTLPNRLLPMFKKAKWEVIVYLHTKETATNRSSLLLSLMAMWQQLWKQHVWQNLLNRINRTVWLQLGL
jgi:hypothetical protein